MCLSRALARALATVQLDSKSVDQSARSEVGSGSFTSFLPSQRVRFTQVRTFGQWPVFNSIRPQWSHGMGDLISKLGHALSYNVDHSTICRLKARYAAEP